MTGERRQALIIANSKYEDEKLSQLSAPEIDAQSLQEVLEDTKIGFFDDVTVLRNQDSQRVREAIEAFFSGRKRGDTLLLYFSGHGVLDPNGRLYLATTNTKTNSLRATGISAQFISESMDASRSKRQILILDCCHSGAFARNSKAAVDRPVGTATAFEGDGTGRVILTATDSTQHAWEGDELLRGDGRSRFTYHLVEGLKSGKADRYGKGRITVDDLYDYVYEQVRDDSPENQPQIPKKWGYNLEGELLVAKNLHTYPKEKRPPPRRVGGLVTIEDLRKLLDDVFETEQIKDIGFDLYIHESQLGKVKSEIIRSLLWLLEEQNRLNDLLNWLSRNVPELFAEVFGERESVQVKERPQPILPTLTYLESSEPTRIEVSSAMTNVVDESTTDSEFISTQKDKLTTFFEKILELPRWIWAVILPTILVVISFSIVTMFNRDDNDPTTLVDANVTITQENVLSATTQDAIEDTTTSEPRDLESITESSTPISVSPSPSYEPPYPTQNLPDITRLKQINPQLTETTSGSLIHQEDGQIEEFGFPTSVTSFIAEARFYNPYDEASWDYGFVFRQTFVADSNNCLCYRLYLTSTGTWRLSLVTSAEPFRAVTLQSGKAENYNTQEDEFNDLLLVAEEDKGYFYVNDLFVAEVDLSQKTDPGRVGIATGLLTSNERDGFATKFENFTIWNLD